MPNPNPNPGVWRTTKVEHMPLVESSCDEIPKSAIFTWLGLGFRVRVRVRVFTWLGLGLGSSPG